MLAVKEAPSKMFITLNVPESEKDIVYEKAAELSKLADEEKTKK